jgi:hypothetical protein
MQRRQREGATPPFFSRTVGVNATRVYSFLLLHILTTSCMYAKADSAPGKACRASRSERLRALFDIVNMWSRRARQRGPRPVWCQPPSSWMEAAVELALIPGPNARGVHFGETNPRGGNATCLTPRVQSKRQSLYFFLLFTGIGCSLIPTQPWRAHLLPPLRPVGNGNRGDTCSEDGRGFRGAANSPALLLPRQFARGSRLWFRWRRRKLRRHRRCWCRPGSAAAGRCRCP